MCRNFVISLKNSFYVINLLLFSVRTDKTNSVYSVCVYIYTYINQMYKTVGP